MGTSEQKGLDALIAPRKFTLGDVARLERIKSPLLSADFSNLVFNLTAMVALRMDADEFVKKADALTGDAIRLGDEMTTEQYHAELERIAEGLTEFGILMPRPDEDAKKKAQSETAGS